MNSKNFVKSILPKPVVPYARMGYGILKASYYYPHYLMKGGHARGPKEVAFEITYLCNEKCIMCPLAASSENSDLDFKLQTEQKKELSTAEIFDIIDQLVKMKVNNLGITGGEPFLRKDLFEVIAYAKKNGINCTVLSNGTLIDQDKAERIVASGLDKIQFSLDGPEEIHDKIRNKKNAFQKTIRSARLLTQAKQKNGHRQPFLSFCCTISAANMEHLTPLVDWAYELNVALFFGYLFYTTDEMLKQTDMIIQMGHAKKENQDVSKVLKMVNVETLQNEIIQVKKRAEELGVYVSFQPDLTHEEIKSRFYDDTYSYVDKCFYPWFAVRINPYGIVYPCSMSIEMGNLRQSSLNNIWNNDKYVKFRRALKENKLFPKCAKCCALNNKIWRYLPSI